MKQDIIKLPEYITFENAGETYNQIIEIINNAIPSQIVTLDFESVKRIDSAGAAIINKINDTASQKKCALKMINLNPKIEQTIRLFQVDVKYDESEKEQESFFEKIGEAGYRFYNTLIEVIILLSNVFYWSFASFFKKKLRRKGDVIHQSILIGVNALPIIGLISFLIGFILALQSAAQLRQFGANIYVADLIAIAMVSEMGPLITAIMVAGRSGSAIAAEIATMTVTEEIDALKTMGIDPIPYLIVPKLFSIMLTLPMLTVFANVIGIIGGMVIGVAYLDIDIIPFYNEVISVLRFKEIITFIVKSIVFAIIIVLTGTYFGLKVKGGSEGVGRATTASVVFSIFMVIVADSILGLIFYLE